MFSRLHAALHRVQGELAHVLDADSINRLCQQLGYRFRHRLLDPVTTIHLFVLQILKGNVAIARLREFAERPFSDAAYCNARTRLPLALLQRLLHRAGDALSPTLDDSGRWHGHRTFHIDGSSFSMPDTPALQDEFGQPGGQKPGCGFPTAHLLTLFHTGTGFLLVVGGSPCRAPATLELFKLRYKVAEPGCGVKTVTLVTTLLDAEVYPATELATFYGQR